MQNLQGIEFKLKSKEQWFCDICGGIIESSKDGMLEWSSNLLDEGGIEAKDFRIVHGGWIKECKGNRAHENVADGHLNWFTGSDGLNALLSISERYSLDTIEFNRIIRRIHLDFYEEGARLIPLAREDHENDIDPYDRGDINQSELLWLIRKYGKDD